MLAQRPSHHKTQYGPEGAEVICRACLRKEAMPNRVTGAPWPFSLPPALPVSGSVPLGHWATVQAGGYRGWWATLLC